MHTAARRRAWSVTTVESPRVMQQPLKKLAIVLVVCILLPPNQPTQAANTSDHLSRDQVARLNYQTGTSQIQPESSNNLQQQAIMNPFRTKRRDNTAAKNLLDEPSQPQKEEENFKVLGLIRGTRELLTPTGLNSLYNYINKRPETIKKRKQQKMAAANGQPIGRDPNPKAPLYQQFPVAGQQPHHDYGQRAIALGRENAMMGRPELDQNGFVPPLLMHPSELGANIGIPPMFEQALHSNRLEQNLIHSYPEPMPELGAVEPQGFENGPEAGFKISRQQQRGTVKDVYLPPDLDYNQRRPHAYSHEYPVAVSDAKGSKDVQQNPAALITHSQRIEAPPEANLGPVPSRLYGDKQTNRERLLSNAQLISLIDELKEFNSRQASKLQSSGLVPPSDKQIYSKFNNDRGGENNPTMSKANDNGTSEAHNNNLPFEDEDDYVEDTSQADAQKPVAQATNGQEGKMSTDELAKFAKFLMTKEGANLKFQLGLEKESPDDGDEEDDRDTLLETKNKHLKTRPKKAGEQRLGDQVDKRNLKAAVQLDKLIDNVAEKTRELERFGQTDEAPTLNKDNNNNINTKQVTNNNVIDDSARKKRNQDSKTTVGSSTEINSASSDSHKRKPAKQIADKDHGEGNFAKMLIKQEILEDQQESSGSSPLGTINDRSEGRKGSVKSPNSKSKLINRNFDYEDVNSRSDIKNDRGEKRYQYPRKERNRDHITLIDQLQKTRQNKANARSRIHMPVDSILKRAMDGELGMQTERTSDGKLSLRGPNRGAVVTLDLPSQRTGQTKEDEGENNSELVSAQIDPDKADGTDALNRVHLQSAKPLKDEYPISERVSDRLNKLSYNLDRYFNDGFLQEIDSKSKLDGDSNQGAKPTREPAQPQTQSSNVNAKKSASQPKGGRPKDGQPKDKGDKEDRDFDIDVSIDGKREKDDDDDRDDEDNDASKAGGESKSKGRGKTGRVTPKGGKKVLKKKKVPSKDSDVEPTAVKQEQTRNEKIEVDANSNPDSNSDPVESESLETPIGPDGDVSADDTPKTNAKKLKSSTEKQISTSYKRGKKTTGNKFYEEPDWR